MYLAFWGIGTKFIVFIFIKSFKNSSNYTRIIYLDPKNGTIHKKCKGPKGGGAVCQMIKLLTMGIRLRGQKNIDNR